MDIADSLESCAPEQLNYPKILYSVVPEILYESELGEYNTYGIQILRPSYTDILHDVSICKKTAEHSAELLNQYKVSIIHLYDVVMDMLP